MLIMSEVDAAMISIVRAKDEDSIQMLRQVLQGLKANSRSDIQEAAFGRLKQIWSSIPTDEQQTLAVLLLDNALDTENEAISTHRKDLSLETLHGLKLSTETLTALLNSLTTTVQMPENPPPAKRRRTSRSETSRVEFRDSDELTQTLRRYTITLELVEKSSPEKHPKLLKPLFQCLGEIQHYKLETDSGLVYLQGLVINSLLGIIRNAKDSKDIPADKSVIRSDLLVDCIRHTTNPQVQNAALLLVSGLSRWVPEAVLHSVMPIFTFMGSTTLRQSDDYSAHVIHQTVSQVIPPLVLSLRKSSRQILNGVVDLLLSFVAAFEHMPQHRRLGLFKKVMTALGPEDCLFAVLVMLVDRYPMDDRAREFLTELLDQFDASVQLLVFEQYVDLLIDLTKPRRGVSEVVLNLREKSNDEIHTITYNLLEALAGLLENPRIRLRIDRSFSGDDGRISSQRQIFAKLIQGAIKNAQSFKSHRDLEERAERVLSDIFQLVPLVELLRSAEPLIQQSIDDVRQVVLTAITGQAEHIKSTDTEAKSALIDFIPNITFVIKNSVNSRLKRTAIACVDQISDRFGKQDSSKINEAARIISGPDALGQSDNAIRIISLLCLASMVDVLRDDFIPLLPDLFSQTFEYLRLSIKDMEPNASLHDACFALINATVEHLPFIFTGNILDTSLQLAQASGACELDIGVQNFRSQFYQLLTEKLSTTELFPALTRNSLRPEQVENLNSILEYAEFAKSAVEHHSKSAVSKNAATLFNFVLQGFDYYRTLTARRQNMELDQAAFDHIENIFLEIAASLTMKLNDVTFRPLFVRLVEWVNELPNDDRLGRSYRATALFQFFRILSGKLKSLITAYSSYVLELAAGLLESTNVKDGNADRLLRATLGALEESFEHDQDDFWQSPSHFETICMPLLSRISKSHSNILVDSVIPTITALAATTNSQDHHKAINSKILQLMRNDMRDTRLAAVKCEQALTERLGEEWLVLLPEMLPFITELLEDDDGEVEKESRRWIKRVEEILGESLEGMLQ
jgi:U3 small nucleolar RNA-associated protein 10